MDARFTKGDSVQTTRTIPPKVRVAKEPPTKAIGPKGVPRHGNTMSGMPGHINAHEREDMGGAKGGKGAGPHREGFIGERGRKNNEGHIYRDGAGTQTKDYRKLSTGKAGTYKKADHIGKHDVHTANRGTMTEHVSGSSEATPQSKGHIHRAGIGSGKSQPKFGTGLGHKGGRKAGSTERVRAAGHDGRMERLRGHSKTSSEGRGKSRLMY